LRDPFRRVHQDIFGEQPAIDIMNQLFGLGDSTRAVLANSGNDRLNGWI